VSNDGTMLQPESALPKVPLVPPPWTLRGHAWIVVMRWPGAVDASTRLDFVPESLRPTLAGPLSLLMYVNYTQAPCGPYRELLFVPGMLRFDDGRRHLSISRIVVSSWDSVVNGRCNWGIPKDRADFEVAGDAERSIKVVDAGREICAIEFAAARGPRLPLNTRWLPQRWLTLAQRHAGRDFYYAPAAQGSVRASRLVAWRFDRTLFPDISRARVLTALRVENFEMKFPVARVSS
jgi:hypothetical protein